MRSSYKKYTLYQRKNSGLSLVELLVAIGLFSLGTVAVLLLLIDINLYSRFNQEKTKAVLLAHEGLSAIRMIRGVGFDNLPNGNFGIDMVGDTWTLVDYPIVIDEYTRSIDISSIDADIQKIVSSVTWQFTASRQSSVSLETYLSDWSESGGDAGALFVDISAATLFLDVDLLGMTVQNISNTSISIDTVTVSWNGGETLDEIVIDGVPVYSALPTTGSPSGELIDIDNVILSSASEIKNIDHMLFSGPVTATDFIVTFGMTDGSQRHTLIDI